ncbi:MAG: TerC family protein [Brevibacillus sp.]|nr:TerC family protein [Brevibacillus sp.]
MQKKGHAAQKINGFGDAIREVILIVEWLTPSFWASLASIVIIDLVLAGDNAVVIGMAAKSLPSALQKRAILFGTIAAIAIRATLTLVVFSLLQIPYLLLTGGLILFWIAYHLLAEKHEEEKEVYRTGTLFDSIRTIVIADVVMGLDNVLAIAGASHGSLLLVVLGLLVSVPIMVAGSTLILKLLKRYPQISYLGAGVLAWTASSMIVDEPRIRPFLTADPLTPWIFQAVAVAAVLLAGRRKQTRVHARH